MSSKAIKDLHAGIVGCGSIGKRHLGNLASLGIGRFSIFDPQPPDISQIGNQIDILFVSSLSALFSQKPDFVIVANPSGQHVPTAMEAARVGCDLFIEKPLATTCELLSKLEESVTSAGVVTMVAANMRFHPGPALVKQRIDAGDIGTPLWARLHSGSCLPKWRPGTDYRRSYSASSEHGGAVLDCIHELDLGAWMFGPGALVAAGHTPARSIGLECEGLAEILTRHSSGVLVSTHLNFIQQNYQREIEVVGTDATLKWSIHRPEVRILKPDADSPFFVDPVPSVHFHTPMTDLNLMYLDEMAHFLHCVLGRVESCNPVALAIQTTRVALEARSTGNSLSER